MAYEDLTTEQKQSLQDWLNGVVRPWSGEQARCNNHADVANTDYNGSIIAILGELSDADMIPNESGLAGSTSLTKAEVVSIVSHIQGVLGSYNSGPHRQLWAKSAGETNLIG